MLNFILLDYHSVIFFESPDGKRTAIFIDIMVQEKCRGIAYKVIEIVVNLLKIIYV